MCCGSSQDRRTFICAQRWVLTRPLCGKFVGQTRSVDAGFWRRRNHRLYTSTSYTCWYTIRSTAVYVRKKWLLRSVFCRVHRAVAIPFSLRMQSFLSCTRVNVVFLLRSLHEITTIRISSWYVTWSTFYLVVYAHIIVRIRYYFLVHLFDSKYTGWNWLGFYFIFRILTVWLIIINWKTGSTGDGHLVRPRIAFPVGRNNSVFLEFKHFPAWR